MKFVVRALALCCTLAYLAVALCCGLDRLAAKYPMVRTFSVWPYGEATAIAQGNAFGGGAQWSRATASYRKALALDPLNSEILGALARTQLMASDAAGAETMFKLSAQRGWRDRGTDLYWLGQATAFGDTSTAAIEADAILRQDVDENLFNLVVQRVTSDDAGQRALAKRLAYNPPWAEDFLHRLDKVDADQIIARGAVVRLAGKRVWQCSEADDIVNRLADIGAATAAREARNAVCPYGGALLNDGRFVRFTTQGPASTLDWQVPATGDIAEEATTASDGTPALHLAVAGSLPRIVLQQRTTAQPGSYQITWRTPDTAPADAQALTVDLLCDIDLAHNHPGTPMPGKPGAYAVSVDLAGSCATPFLTFWMQPGKAVNITDVALIASSGKGSKIR